MTTRTCSVEGCGRGIHARSLCHMHYERLHEYGNHDMRPEPLTNANPIRDNATPHGPVDGLEPHYRPWSVPPLSDTTTVIAELPCWQNAGHAQLVMAAWERASARLDAETTARWNPTCDEQGIWTFNPEQLRRAA